MALPNRSTIATYNGAGKVNYALVPPANSVGANNTDWDNPSLATCTSDVSALGQTACRFWARVQLATTTGGMSVLNWQSMWSNTPTSAPVPARTSSGLYTLTLPTLVSDEYDYSVGVSDNITVNLLAAEGSLEGANFHFISASASGNVITINTATAAGTSAADLTCICFIKAY